MPIKTIRQFVAHFSFVRFLLSGGFNTFFTWLMYIVLLNYFSYKTSYTISYVIGIIIAFTINRFFVFKSHRGIYSYLLFPLVYVFQYLAGLFIIWLWVDVINMNAIVAPIISVLILIPCTYILTKLIFKGTT